MKKRISFFLSILLLSTHIFSEALFQPDSAEAQELQSLYTLCGRVMPSDSYPFSRNDMIGWAEALRDGVESQAVENRLDALIDELTIENRNNSFELDWQVGYEHYFRTEEITEDPVMDYLEELPLATVGTSFVNYDYGGACLELFLKREYSEFPDNNFFESKTGNPVALENQIVKKGYAYFENDLILLSVGRLPSHYGNPHFSSFMANQNLPFLDQIKMDMNISGFRLESYLATLENREAEGDLDTSGFGEYTIWTTMHRLVYSFGNVKLSLAEQAFISRDNNQLYIGDISPLIVSHNAWLSKVNISMFTDLSWVIIPGFEFYFQWGFDDISATDVFGIADSGLPTIDAHILGLYYQNEFKEYPFSIKLEYGDTHYLWGSFDSGWYFEEAIYRIYLDGDNQLIPFSSPYGPGTLWVDFETEVETGIGLDASLSFLYLNKNLLADLISTDYERADEEMEDASHRHIFEVGLNLNYNLFEMIDIYVKPEVLNRFTLDSEGVRSDENTWFECTVGCEISGNEAFKL